LQQFHVCFGVILAVFERPREVYFLRRWEEIVTFDPSAVYTALALAGWADRLSFAVSSSSPTSVQLSLDDSSVQARRGKSSTPELIKGNFPFISAELALTL